MSQFKHNHEQARKLWVEALRSGKYEQAHNCLEDESGALCCLGVLVRTFMQHEAAFKINVVERLIESEGSPEVEILFDEESAMLPEKVQAWAGLRGSGGEYDKSDPEGPACALYTDNDENGKSLADIAAIIESAPAGLFVEAVQ